MPTTVPTVQLQHGALMPRLGLGTWPMDDQAAETCIATAIEAGYRLFDTAENYGNERGVGRGLRAGGLPREQLFVTTKFNKQWHGVDLVADACQRSAERLGVEYLDLLLIHWPNPEQDRYVAAWEGLIRLLEGGRVRAIGTSNFKPAHLERLIQETGVTPDVNQVQLNPLVVRASAQAFHTRQGIVTESWSPLGGQRIPVLPDPLVVRLAAQYQRTPAQVVLRWHVQQGLVPIPKSSDPARIQANLDVFNFELTAADMAALSGLDQGATLAVDSDRFGH